MSLELKSRNYDFESRISHNTSGVVIGSDTGIWVYFTIYMCSDSSENLYYYKKKGSVIKIKGENRCKSIFTDMITWSLNFTQRKVTRVKSKYGGVFLFESYTTSFVKRLLKCYILYNVTFLRLLLML